MLRMILGSPRRRNPTQSPTTPHLLTPLPSPATHVTFCSTPNPFSTPAGTTPINHHTQDTHDPRRSPSDGAEDPDETAVDSDLDTSPTQIPADETLEPWADWIKRCTHYAEHTLHTLGIADWVTQRRQQQQALAARVAAHNHDRWTIRALEWDPQIDPRLVAKRRTGRPCRRWADNATDLSKSVKLN